MFTLKDRQGVYQNSTVYHYPDGDPLGCGEAVCDGTKRCRVALDDKGTSFCVAPNRPLPTGLRWMKTEELV
jgi:hypothetical protein